MEFSFSFFSVSHNISAARNILRMHRSEFECPISQPLTVIDGQIITERNVSLLFGAEQNNDHYDDLLPADE
jgi:hypothetical protein